MALRKRTNPIGILLCCLCLGGPTLAEEESAVTLTPIESGRQGWSFVTDEGSISPEGQLELILKLHNDMEDRLWFAQGREYQAEGFDQIVLRVSSTFLVLPSAKEYKFLELESGHDTGGLFHYVLLNRFGSAHSAAVRIMTDYGRINRLLSASEGMESSPREVEVRIGAVCWIYNQSARCFEKSAVIISEPLWFRADGDRVQLVGYSHFGIRLENSKVGRFGLLHPIEKQP